MTLIRLLKKRLALLSLGALAFGAAATAPAVRAQDGGALLNALVRKGILSDQEAEDVRAELAAESAAAVLQTVSGGKSTNGINFTGRLQVQYANLETTDERDATGQARVSHFFLRRVYIGMKGTLGANFTADFNYDFAGAAFDKAYIRWAGSIGGAPFSFDAGFRKPNFGYEEYTSSGSLRAIERSGVTRYFAEDVNGRRLGSASYRVGLFADYNPNAFAGKAAGFFAGAALTNPERVATPATIVNAGNDTTGKIAVWANAGYSGRAGASTTYLVGVAGALLPGQGGVNSTVGSGIKGRDITQGAIYADVTAGKFQIAGEYLFAKVERGVSAGSTKDASVSGFWLQPAFKFNDTWELVGRYSRTDTGGRGIRAGDGVRSATATATAKCLDEYYLGANYCIVATDVKLQLGYVGGRTSGALASGGAVNKETVAGFRTQLQVNF
ncbi:MAG: OprO/OprP family phosphate-selective porin [Opitutaceae bacterium]|jgi:hypothetical protein|nr:OprO/OprP family phosphate-selective porin [Opitutaceae bacterium]